MDLARATRLERFFNVISTLSLFYMLLYNIIIRGYFKKIFVNYIMTCNVMFVIQHIEKYITRLKLIRGVFSIFKTQSSRSHIIIQFKWHLKKNFSHSVFQTNLSFIWCCFAPNSFFFSFGQEENKIYFWPLLKTSIRVITPLQPSILFS